LPPGLGDNVVVTATPPRPITAEHLRGLPGLRRNARDALLAAQPATVRQALQIRDIGRKTIRHLLALGLLYDDDGMTLRMRAHAEREARRWRSS
jgi:hypothetical protein